MSRVFEQIQITSKSLRGNKLDDDPTREVLVYLPPSYHHNPTKRYPVIYLLHGFGGTPQGWFSNTENEPSIHLTMAKLLKEHKIEEMIIAVPDTRTRFTGAGYQNNAIQGNWLDFISEELPAAIEAKYRCKNGPEHRALMGHSSGADGVLKTLLFKPGFFKQAVAMSPAHINADNPSFFKQLYQTNQSQLAAAADAKLSVEQLDVWQHLLCNRFQQILPAADHPPLFCRFPQSEQDWQGLAESAFQRLIPKLEQQLAGITLVIDIGKREETYQDCLTLVEQMQQRDIDVTLFEFDGGHVDHMGKSLVYVLTWLSQVLMQTR
ncbi:alpha/beta hydrolase [Motilimonas eburnea]|uniref:alpha/beta hydrolase n=1 Tax=Motilimonas eburnea TaxID=1737488 RepID=UPI001E45D673|nr:alpha/beta hydrolase-fold protein [Motilimonas eburnea]MCE2572731.1 hypothetical protein [Motilimonas eburnea]